ncbi:MAG TPA: metal-dependent hydrolase [Anseongella sp.]|nr:metal-dependent hydrolase [Anseongella sp.]
MAHITYYGHSCFLVETGGKKLLFDPFITPNELAKDVDMKSIEADYLLISHGHEDHIADAVALAGQTGAKVICNWEVSVWLGGKGLKNIHPMNTGGKLNTKFGLVKCVTAHHSSGLPDGSYGGNPMGFIVKSGSDTFYYAGDTALTLDMQLIPEWFTLDFAFLPVGDNFTMDVDDAIKASDFIQCSDIIGMHYDTFEFIRIDHKEVNDKFEREGKKLALMKIGETLTK